MPVAFSSHTMVKLIGKIHLWLGLASGIVVVIVGLTGCLYVFQEELTRLAGGGVWIPVERRAEPFAPVATYLDTIARVHEGELARVTFDVFYRSHDAVIAWVRDTDRKYTAYILDPYTGEVINRFKYSLSFWSIVLAIHTSLGIPVVGHHIVAASTLIFLILLITGLVLWWPTKPSEVKRSFWFRWRKTTSIRRVNYDLHNVLGFYTLFALVFITVSALTMSYGWFDQGVAWLVDGGAAESTSRQADRTMPEHLQQISSSGDESGMHGTWTRLHDAYQPLERVFVTCRANNDTIAINVYPQSGATYNRHEAFRIHAKTGEIVGYTPWSSKRNSQVYKEAELNLHIGSILGFPGKVLAFISCLVATSLPVTGFYVWWFRGRKKRKLV